jgi:hypothetical protein
MAAMALAASISFSLRSTLSRFFSSSTKIKQYKLACSALKLRSSKDFQSRPGRLPTVGHLEGLQCL